MLSQVVILCGGMGTRLGKLTQDTPKPLLPVSGRPFLDTLIEEVSRFGFSEIVLLAGRFAEQVVQRYDGQTRNHTTIRVLSEPKPLGTGGALRFADPHLADEFLLMNGDSWIDTDLAAFCARWDRSGQDSDVQMLLQTVPDAGRFGTVEHHAGQVTAFNEKDTSKAGKPGQINSGVYIIRKKALSQVPQNVAVSLEQDILPNLVAAGRVRAEEAAPDSYFIDIGVPDSYAQAQTEIEQTRRRPALFLDRDGTLNKDSGYTHRPEDLEWIEGAREAIQLANAMGWYVFVVTNQGGVALGHYPEEAVVTFHREMQRQLRPLEAHIDALVWCPHRETGKVDTYVGPCDCRKPAPGMLEQLARDWPIHLSQSIMIGDREKDMQAANSFGVAAALYTGGSLCDLVAQHIKKTGAENVGQ